MLCPQAGIINDSSSPARKGRFGDHLIGLSCYLFLCSHAGGTSNIWHLLAAQQFCIYVLFYWKSNTESNRYISLCGGCSFISLLVFCCGFGAIRHLHFVWFTIVKKLNKWNIFDLSFQGFIPLLDCQGDTIFVMFQLLLSIVSGLFLCQGICFEYDRNDRIDSQIY